MRNARRITDRTIICLTAVLLLTIVAGCAPFSISIQPNTEQKPADVAAYSQEPRSEAEVAADVKACREYATKSTSFDSAVVKKWPDTWVEPIKEFFRIETEQARWNRYYSTCMEARRYKVK